MCRTDNRRTVRVTEWEPRDGKGKQDRELDEEMRSKFLTGWPGIDEQPTEMSREGWGKHLSRSGNIKEDNDDCDE